MRYRSPIRQLLLLLCTLLPSVAVGQVEFLDQNWDASTRQFYYTTSQGSRLLPYDWFLALEVSDGQGSFLRERVTQLGYLANSNLNDNPDRLPVGFVADTDWSGEKYMGLNCAACHTNQISYKGKTYQIDGGPALADMWNLLVGIGDSLNATLDQPEKFSRFAASVLGPNPRKRKARRLKKELSEFIDYWNQLIADSTIDHPWGRARLDAFGMIFNRVGSIDLEEPRNNRKPDAPVSYPFLWGTSWEDKVQWNGSAPNTNDIERLGRNVGEVLGVFAQADLRKAHALRPYYRSSARRLNQLRLENRLKNLWSPAWPEHLGTIDAAKAEAGRLLFNNHCAKCHEVIPHGEQRTKVKVVMTPLDEAGTDPRMAMNAVRYTALTGRLEGSQVPGLDRLGAEIPRGALLANVVRGALISPFRDVELTRIGLDRISSVRRHLHRLLELDITDKDVVAFFNELDVSQDEFFNMARKYEEKVTSSYAKAMTLSADPAAEREKAGILAYKARPLDGIWATAPYLHNGSIPNLYELVSPVNERSTTFFVGSNEFDPIHVGFQTDEVEGSTLLDTSLPGNRNIGHDTYGDFDEVQRWQLVEYMKTL